MRKAWYNFLKDGSRSARIFLRTSTVLILLLGTFSIGGYSHAQNENTEPSPVPSVSLLTLPEFEVHFIQRNGNGDVYQIGDRIPLSVALTGDSLQNQTHFLLALPEGASTLEDQGWYLDPHPQILSGSLHFIVSPLQTGKLILPTLLITKEEDGTPIGRTSTLSIQVAELKKKDPVPELKELTDIPLALKYWLLFGGLGLLLAGGTAFFIRRYLKQRNLHRKVSDVPPPKKEADHTIALNDLDRLYKNFTDAQLKAISFGISEILKEYFSARFHIDAKESTTDEMLALLKREAISRESISEIQNLFNDLDFIKFTKAEISRESERQSYISFRAKAKAIIDQWATSGGSA